MNREDFESLIENVADFPKKGVIFKDFSPLLAEKLDEVTIQMGEGINWSEVDLILGIESRGFILGSAMAIKFQKGFLPIRKKGKLPPPIIGETYDLEYGQDTLEMKINSKKLRVVVVDDVLATGGTLKAALNLCEKNNYEIKAVSVLIDLQFLNSLASQRGDIFSVLKYS